jgi:uncharacterized RDD family membrane protein YckC
MKCPKCGYLGFETSDRCRNCGYDFSLSQHVPPAPELPLQQAGGAGAPLADLDLTARATPRDVERTPELDLDRLIGGQTVVAAPRLRVVEAPPAAVTAQARQSSAAAERGGGEPPAKDGSPSSLPLFTPGAKDAADATRVATPRRAGAPLSVRRSTPDVPKGRSARPPRPSPRRDDSGLALQLDSTPAAAPESSVPPPRAPVAVQAPASAGAVARLFAALIDLVLMGAVDSAVLYFTLAIAGLTVEELRLLPVVPLAAFLLLLNGGYLVTFTAAGGQTIGKMAAGIRVMNDDYQRVDFTGALLRAGGCVVSLLTIGMGFLPVFFSADGRTLQDRLAGTRVVRAR